jgi:hypothetical protein
MIGQPLMTEAPPFVELLCFVTRWTGGRPDESPQAHRPNDHTMMLSHSSGGLALPGGARLSVQRRGQLAIGRKHASTGVGP